MQIISSSQFYDNTKFFDTQSTMTFLNVERVDLQLKQQFFLTHVLL